ncbi:MAG: hypothetical protein ACOVP5_01715 [Chitinophagales bacterium]
MRLSILLLFFIFYSCENKLIYGLQVNTIDGIYSINDKNGYPILQEEYLIKEDKKNGKIKYLQTYSQTDNRLIVKLVNYSDEIKYVFIKPKAEQNYAELEVDYTVYTEAEYKKLNLKDDWVNIRY